MREKMILIRETVKTIKQTSIPLTMQEIWDDHHRKIREIDRRFKIRIKVLFVAAILLIVAMIIVAIKY